ncbi:Z1 domain-containing protein [Xanthomonas campestris]|uniref:Z1 domain-containing protein n=1 Tax=Xanthomonas campestris TaxID=339 RepID=UPI0025A0ECD9|nr:Z1 domain-containing protein [Xanthomonas campestris]MDM7593235.1 Z1 domain-containing protein [Xanthomonas campestris]MEA9865211.1 Z1 domain-containing protein [Xanthomonas campestris pv. raphani]
MPESTPLVEQVYFSPPASLQPESWWARYKAQLTGLTDTARASVEADSRYILLRGILAADTAKPEEWSSRRSRTGLVMGSVQSGKTASMLGVSALAIDYGLDIIVVLAGTRLSLWRQTYERLLQQLDSGEENAQKIKRRLLCPPPSVALSEQTYPLTTTYRLPPAQVRQRLSQGKPLIIVAMKQTDHLHALAASLRTSVFGAVKELGRTAHMLVLDDEADDGSILDAVVESSQDPIYGRLKQIPRAIANLWDPPQGSPGNLFSTYIAYTATPQANLLQEDHNPLAPRDFMISLRTPLDVGHPVDMTDLGNLNAPRSSTYPEIVGIRSYYTGGEVFYRRAEAAGLCVPTTNSAQQDLADAVRAFLVAGAIRLYRSGKLGPASAIKGQFDTEEEALADVALPHSMLYHPSAAILDHFQGAEDVLLWAGIQDRATARKLLDAGDARLPDTLVNDLQADPTPWAQWLDKYIASAGAIKKEFNVLPPKTFPDWQTVEALLIGEVIPGTRVAVVNSDPNADERPAYTPSQDPESGKWSAARDVSTIFVSGNVMARGLTLEGMTTALFQRSSANPLADTQMQMQRWFGYRGSYIELCRVFASSEQLTLFRAYHDVDEAVRTAITERMMGGAPEPTVLQGLNFEATGKIAGVGNLPLSPGARPFVTVINNSQQADPNADVVAELFARSSSDLSVANVLRGRILDVPLKLTEAAELLDRLTFADYQPGSEGFHADFWSRIEARAHAITPISDPPFYRPPVRHGEGDPTRRACPYAIAAYLRFWSASLTRSITGLFVTGHPGDLWSYADLDRKATEQPRFWVGIRYGDGAVVSSGPLALLPFNIHATTKRVVGGELKTTWGASDPNAGQSEYRGDVYFDYYHHRRAAVPSSSNTAWRPSGADGQILFYVNQHPGDLHPTVAVGLCLPAGGPEQFSATRAGAATVTKRLP